MLCSFAGCGSRDAPAPYWQAARPAYEFAELYERVQQEQLYPDSKSFADAQPRRAPELIMRDYRAAPDLSREQLAEFVKQNFTPAPNDPGLPSANLDLPHYISALWPQLTQPSTQPLEFSTALGAPFAYEVPGGRLRELHYSESYFIMLGLLQDGRRDLAQGMLDDCAALINRFGHMPAGARTYYLSRSGLPLFHHMIQLLYAQDPAAGYGKYLLELMREYSFWMQGSFGLQAGHSVEHVVALADGALLNRFWDPLKEPRDEAFNEDRALAIQSKRDRALLYHEIRAAAESEWGLSARWLADPADPASVQATSILPVDLNSVLFGLERAIAAGCEQRHRQPCATEFLARAWRRKQAINKYLWLGAEGRYADYNWQSQLPSNVVSAATLYPLFEGIASNEQAQAVAHITASRLLGRDGLGTTVGDAGALAEVWSPLQWIAVRALLDYNDPDLAHQISQRWLNALRRDYAASGQLRDRMAPDGRYDSPGDQRLPVATLGGTAGVARALLNLEPELLRAPLPPAQPDAAQ